MWEFQWRVRFRTKLCTCKFVPLAIQFNSAIFQAKLWFCSCTTGLMYHKLLARRVFLWMASGIVINLTTTQVATTDETKRIPAEIFGARNRRWDVELHYILHTAIQLNWVIFYHHSNIHTTRTIAFTWWNDSYNLRVFIFNRHITFSVIKLRGFRGIILSFDFVFLIWISNMLELLLLSHHIEILPENEFNIAATARKLMFRWLCSHLDRFAV